MHALQGAGEQPQQKHRYVHLHIPLRPPACFSPPGEKVVSSPPLSASSSAAPTGIRGDDRLPFKGPNVSATRTSTSSFPPPPLPEARSVVTGESGSAHAEANASEDRELSAQRRSAGTRAEQQVPQPRLLGGDIGGEKPHSERIVSVSRKLHNGGTFAGPRSSSAGFPWAPGPVGTRLHPHRLATTHPPHPEERRVGSECCPALVGPVRGDSPTGAWERAKPEPRRAVSPVRGTYR